MFYDSIFTDALAGQLTNPPFISQANVYDGNLDTGWRDRAGFPSNITFWPLDLPTSTHYLLQFRAPAEIQGSMILEANYVGNQGRHLQRFLNLNQLPAGTRLAHPTAASTPMRFVRTRLREHQFRDHSDNTNYNALQLSLNRRMRTGLSFGLNYTWSRSLDMTLRARQDSYNARADYGLSGIHRAHVLNLNYIYELPFLPNTRTR